MGKPESSVYRRFVREYENMNRKLHKEQYLVPYLMSSHPGSTLQEAVELAEFLRELGYMPEQVQDFYPTPSTISTCMYYTGLDPRTMEPIYVPKSAREKAMQRALIQYRNPANYDLVREALVRAGRQDLIGWDEQCLIRPIRPKKRDGEGEAPRRGASGRNGKVSKSGKPSRPEAGRPGAADKGGKPGKGSLPKAGSPRRPGPARPERAGKPPKANGRKGGIRKGR